MDFFTKKYESLRNWVSNKGVTDPRFIGLVILSVIGLSVLWSGARVVQQNYDLVQKITVLEEENRILELENRNKEIQIEYYKTPEFAELKARKVNGKAAKGETVYIVTEETAEQALKTPSIEEISFAEENKPEYQKNFESWVDFFFGG